MWFNMLFPLIGCNGKKSKKSLAKYENSIEWQNTFVNLLNIATYRFEWTGLPETCNERFLELALLTNGVACMGKDKDRGFLTLIANLNYGINLYGDYTKVQGIGWNGFNKQYTSYVEGGANLDVNAVLCRDNNVMYPYISYIIRATDRLTSAMRSIDTAAKKLKNPYFISCDESQNESIKRILDDIDGNTEAIVTSKSTYADMFKVFPTSIDINVLNILWTHYNNLDNQIRTILGIQNNDQSAKRERLLVDEVNANNEYTDINIDMRLRERQKFCDICNEVFGTNISVSLRQGGAFSGLYDPTTASGGEGTGVDLGRSEQ